MASAAAPPVGAEGEGCEGAKLFGTELLVTIINLTPDICFGDSDWDIKWHRQRLACVCKAFAAALECQETLAVRLPRHCRDKACADTVGAALATVFGKARRLSALRVWGGDDSANEDLLLPALAALQRPLRSVELNNMRLPDWFDKGLAGLSNVKSISVLEKWSDPVILGSMAPERMPPTLEHLQVLATFIPLCWIEMGKEIAAGRFNNLRTLEVSVWSWWSGRTCCLTHHSA
ncbi:hypothetical protein Rsub_08139 [Raphidocelis subcapitata]|uniref:Uncharacterized protein n=1 Tax=Raphidocelis subcapitata TaxID=307507 RepID=A0A2V0P4X1_9CHLO|nr:hypothetical protein Rsub_08139 [Raphidocelis subcapitata]|eukprot:GBF94896.1 hypothetical protein Rsub_08139 [Raphidocelis subcapitata]